MVEKADFNAPISVQKQNFEHYVDFLNKNGLDHIYKTESNPTNTAFDKKINAIDFVDGLDTIKGCSEQEAFRRIENYYRYVWDKTSALEKRNKRLRRQLDAIEKQYDEIASKKDILELKSVKAIIKLKEFFNKQKN